MPHPKQSRLRQDAFNAGLLGVGEAARLAPQALPGDIPERAAQSRISSPSRERARLVLQGLDRSQVGEGIGAGGDVRSFIKSQPERLGRVKQGLTAGGLTLLSLLEATLGAEIAEKLTGKKLPISERISSGPSTTREFFRRPPPQRSIRS